MAERAQNTTHYTYGDYSGWPDDERWELIDGAAYNMTPAPTPNHQGVVGNLFGIIFGLLRAHPCRVLASPLDILLPEGDEADEDVDTTVQPDIVVICRPEIIRWKNVRGAPDWVTEVLSPSTAKKDEGVKRDRYQRAGVTEYWLVHPTDRTLARYRLRDDVYGLPEIFGHDDRVDLLVPEGAEIDLAEVFDTGVTFDQD